jgi:hypothetical protein
MAQGLMTAVASVIDSNDPDEIEEILDGIPDPAGSFYRFNLAGSLLQAAKPVMEGIRMRRKRMHELQLILSPAWKGTARLKSSWMMRGNVANTYFQIPELRGFERFCVGRPVEEVPMLTNRICGVCPEAHHMAGAKAADAVYGVEPPRTAKMLRELLYMAFLFH